MVRQFRGVSPPGVMASALCFRLGHPCLSAAAWQQQFWKWESTQRSRRYSKDRERWFRLPTLRPTPAPSFPVTIWPSSMLRALFVFSETRRVNKLLQNNTSPSLGSECRLKGSIFWTQHIPHASWFQSNLGSLRALCLALWTNGQAI